MSATGASMSLRALLSSDAIPVGHLIFEFATPGIGYLVRNAGADYLIFDLEHSGFGFETAKRAVLAARAAQLPIVVRVPSHDAKDLGRACDVGADGVMAPNVRSAAEAKAIVDAVKYVPQGHRGVGMVQMHDRYRVGPFADKARAANDAMCVFAQIESRAGARDADAIAAVPGVDCLFIGHMDLSCSLGTPGEFDSADFRAAVESVLAGCRRHGKRAGRMARNVDEAVALAAAGFDCLALGTDTQVYQAALAQGITDLRARLARHG
jgi:2-dehydro-3-deoxyglucarate aldolase/4-hydroxy-2-oxoheptanedioate aldolase